MEAERSALQAEYEKHIQTANDEMAQLAQEDGADKFKAMTEALTKYEDFPGEETQKQHQQLKEHWDAVLERTKGELRELIAATNPNEIKDKLAEYDGYADGPALTVALTLPTQPNLWYSSRFAPFAASSSGTQSRVRTAH